MEHSKTILDLLVDMDRYWIIADHAVNDLLLVMYEQKLKIFLFHLSSVTKHEMR